MLCAVGLRIENELIKQAVIMAGVFYLDRYAAIKAIFKNVKIMEWISITKSLPKESEDVLVWCKKKLTKGFQAEIYCYEDGLWYSTRTGCFEDNVTHWMPLPESP